MRRHLDAAVVLAMLVSASACSAGSGSVSQGASPTASAIAPVDASPNAGVAVKSAANLRACRGEAVVKIKHGTMLQQAIDGGGYLMGAGDRLSIVIATADAVSGDAESPTGSIGDAAGRAFKAAQGIQSSGTQGTIDPDTAKVLLDAVDETVRLCKEAGVTSAELAAIPLPVGLGG